MLFCRLGILRMRPLISQKYLRTFLSDEFKCSTEWQSRLNAPFMQTIKMDTLYYDIEQTFQLLGKASAIDIDIFVNKFQATSDNIHHIDEISDLLHKLRMTEETSNTLDSTGHAVIRNFLDCGQIEELLNILDNRLSYGVFLDDYIACYTLDYLIKRKDFTSAAKVACQLMLQEDFRNELTRSLSLYACWNYMKNPELFYPLEEKVEVDDSEKVVVRVKFIRNEFFDDHFDIKNNYHLVGKTFVSIGRELNDNFGKNVQLFGEILFEKFENANKILKSDTEFFKDILIRSLEHIEKISDGKEPNENLEKLKALLNHTIKDKKLNENNFDTVLKKFVENIVIKVEPNEIEKQKHIYHEWNKIREDKLNDEIKRLDRTKRLKAIEKIQQNMSTEEQKLWFFENEDKIDLQIDSKKVYYPKRWFGKKKKPRLVDEGYVPPEIIRHRNK